ncbi:MAG: ATP-dependent RNA helicase HrpA [Desulfobacterales bacterium]|nr:ATP-dependent RNA helicase HrpA [Desulfobacterales bacterium]
MHGDRCILRRELSRFKKMEKNKKTDEKKLKQCLMEIQNRFDKSSKNKQNRRKSRPKPSYDENLPITAKKEEIVEAIKNHQVVIISGETGSGKTTQIPKMCMEAGKGIDGKIGCTQPRRIAAITVAERISEELNDKAGHIAGYKIRFKDSSGPENFIKVMTDGILLAEAHQDHYLNEYDTIIVDEAHERSLNIDFILGILKTLLKKRRNLTLIITSATIDTEKFSRAFGNAPVIEVSGRMYPVEVRYLSSKKDEELTYVDMAVKSVRDIVHQTFSGDILVFMPTEQDIRETCETISGGKEKNLTVLPLFARLSAAEQKRVFYSVPGRKVIVATNIAETSITIPGIKYVVDTGVARISQYVPRSRTTSLPVVPISKSSADQRMGRCGRVENGICIRLFSEDDYLARPLFTPPEILRANLAEVILRMIALKLGDITIFPFVDTPAPVSIKDGYDLLQELGAIKPAKGKIRPGANRFLLTSDGRQMASLPLDPRLSRIVIEAQKENCVEEILVIASALSIQDPRERPVERGKEADEAQKVFKDELSDFITLLNIWKAYQLIWEKDRGAGSLKKFCKAHFLSFKRMREWRDIHNQIRQELSAFTSPQKTKTPSKKQNTGVFPHRYTAVHKSVLSGFLSNIATKKEQNFFNAARQKEVMIFPGSTLFGRAGSWIVAAEMVETSRLFARTTANIDVQWLEALGKSQLKYSYFNPHWERNRGEVVASEQVSLYGLIIIPERSVSYGRINPEEASEIFIRSALVDGDVRQPLEFMKYNRALIEEVREIEDRIRRRDLLISEENQFQFYKERLEGVFDIRTLQHMIRKKGSDTFLNMNKEKLLLYDPDKDELDLFPEKIAVDEHQLTCDYRFRPGAKEDGVSIKIPAAIASGISSGSIDWVVPGLIREKIEAMVKGLAKKYRKQLVPVAGKIDIILKELSRENIPLPTALSRFVYKRFGIEIPAAAWPMDALPDHLKMRIAVTDAKGEIIRSGRDKSILYEETNTQEGSEALESIKKQKEKTGIRDWNFGDLDETITLSGQRGEHWVLYPGLVSEDDSVSIRLFSNIGEAAASHRSGICKLYELRFQKDLNFLKKSLYIPAEVSPYTKYFGGAKNLEKQMLDRVKQDLFAKNIRTRTEFESHAASVANRIVPSGEVLLETVKPVLSIYHEIRTAIYNLETANISNVPGLKFLAARREDLNKLLPENFMEIYKGSRFKDLERYIKAAGIRVKRGIIDLEKDNAKTKELAPFVESMNNLLKSLSITVSREKRDAVEIFFWMLEEYKISLFAQEIKTGMKISAKRLKQHLKDIEKMI